MPDRHNSLRARLGDAAAFLRERDADDLAQAVDTVLGPNGWTALRSTDIAADSGTSPSLPLRMAKTDKEQVVAAAKAAGDVLTNVVNEGWARFLDGSFTPRPFQRAPHGSRPEQAVLNVRPSATLRGQVEARGETPSRIAVDFLLHRYEVGPYAAGHTEKKSRPRGAARHPMVPVAVRDAIRAAVKAAGEISSDVVDEGLEKYLAGEFVPVAPEWPADADTVALKINPNDELYTAAGKAGTLRASQVAVAYLLHRYGIDPGMTG